MKFVIYRYKKRQNLSQMSYILSKSLNALTQKPYLRFKKAHLSKIDKKKFT